MHNLNWWKDQSRDWSSSRHDRHQLITATLRAEHHWALLAEMQQIKTTHIQDQKKILKDFINDSPKSNVYKIKNASCKVRNG